MAVGHILETVNFSVSRKALHFLSTLGTPNHVAGPGYAAFSPAGCRRGVSSSVLMRPRDQQVTSWGREGHRKELPIQPESPFRRTKCASSWLFSSRFTSFLSEIISCLSGILFVFLGISNLIFKFLFTHILTQSQTNYKIRSTLRRNFFTNQLNACNRMPITPEYVGVHLPQTRTFAYVTPAEPLKPGSERHLLLSKSHRLSHEGQRRVSRPAGVSFGLRSVLDSLCLATLRSAGQAFHRLSLNLSFLKFPIRIRLCVFGGNLAGETRGTGGGHSGSVLPRSLRSRD